MDFAVSLSLLLPKLYIGNALRSFEIPLPQWLIASGLVALALGMVVGLAVRRNWGLILVLASVGVSHAYVAIAGYFKGQLPSDLVLIPFFCFLVAQLVIIAAVLWRSVGSLVAAMLLSWFCITYALFAGSVGQMAFVDVWA